MTKQTHTGWEVYERLIARMMADQIGTDLCVTPNVRVRGKVSGTVRQLDVVIEDRHDREDPRTIVVDAKTRRRKVDVKDVESFLGLMQDVGATHGFLVCPTGFTKAAERRAQSAITLRLVPLDRIGDFDPSKWPACRETRCVKGRIFWDGYPEMSLGLRPVDPAASHTVVAAYVHEVGKCDRCGRFHVHCLTCDDIMAVPDDDPEDIGHQCRCKLPWFWLASIKLDGQGRQIAELHLVAGLGNWWTVDRRPI